MQHFQIIVNAMLAWSDEPKAPRKTVAARHPGIAAQRDPFDDEEEEELIDDDFEPEDDLHISADAAEPAETELPVADPAD
jgi:hypothetical protein